VNKENDEIKIESGIPVPTKRARPGQWTDLFRQMKEGDSVLMSYEDGIRFRTAVSGWKDFRSISHVVKHADQNEGTQMRIWKVRRGKERGE